MRDIRQVVQGLKPALMMVMVQISFASVNVLYKLAINDGMNVKVPIAYRLMFAAATTILLALFFERFTNRHRNKQAAKPLHRKKGQQSESTQSLLKQNNRKQPSV
ncbi:transmembrane protein, putative [Medicago truncatula]|uniref:Transmembrane protein, putative n=1 Tax=Medicago truncatula TaxID=3880 RepID=G7IQ16_MEDTR|nr:transmembrane protein, putative [Medicago truncatula]